MIGINEKFVSVIGRVRIVSGAESMKRYGVRPPVRLTAQHGLTAANPLGKCGQCHVISVRR